MSPQDINLKQKGLKGTLEVLLKASISSKLDCVTVGFFQLCLKYSKYTDSMLSLGCYIPTWKNYIPTRLIQTVLVQIHNGLHHVFCLRFRRMYNAQFNVPLLTFSSNFLSLFYSFILNNKMFLKSPRYTLFSTSKIDNKYFIKNLDPPRSQRSYILAKIPYITVRLGFH